jgi:hypothetical protein
MPQVSKALVEFLDREDFEGLTKASMMVDWFNYGQSHVRRASSRPAGALRHAADVKTSELRRPAVGLVEQMRHPRTNAYR